jgi:transcriptional regulator with XRE-family HTH domain
MSDFGGKLRLARERRGISLRQIAASTKISIAALEALERNDMSKLPGGIFSNAVVRVVVIEVGDAGAFAFSLDGKPGKSLGQTGQIRTARITRDTLAQFLE